MSETPIKGVRLGAGQGDLLLSVVYSLYRTIREEARWPTILKQIQDLLQADTCSLSIHDFRQKKGSISIHSGCFDEQHLRLYNETYCSIDPWLRREELYRAVGTTWVGEELFPSAQLVTTGFYRDWLRPQGLMHQCCGILFREKDTLIYLTALRSARAQPFGQDALYPLQRLLPHLRQTLELQEMVGGIHSADAQPLDDVVRRLGSAALIMDAERQLLAASEKAHEMLADGGPIELDESGIRGGTPEQTERLKTLVDRAMKTAQGDGLSPGGTLEISGGESGSVTVKVDPLPAGSLPGQARAAVLLTVNDDVPTRREEQRPRRRWLPLVLRKAEDRGSGQPRADREGSVADGAASAPNAERLKRLYDLTRSEAKLAELLACGYGVPRAARELGVGLNTVRTHLQRIFSKTDTHHQSELVALLLAGPAKLAVQYHRNSAADGWVEDGQSDDDRAAASANAGIVTMAPSAPAGVEKRPRNR